MIDVKDLHKHFGKTVVLSGVNQHISKGEKVVVIGPLATPPESKAIPVNIWGTKNVRINATA